MTDLPFDLSKPEPRDEMVTFYTTKRISDRLKELAESTDDASVSFIAHRIVEQALMVNPRRRATDAA